MTIYDGDTFGNMLLANHAEDVFRNCTFTGEMKRCNFALADFEPTCTFDGASFVDCNLEAAIGIDAVPASGMPAVSVEDALARLDAASIVMGGLRSHVALRGKVEAQKAKKEARS